MPRPCARWSGSAIVACGARPGRALALDLGVPSRWWRRPRSSPTSSRNVGGDRVVGRARSSRRAPDPRTTSRSRTTRGSSPTRDLIVSNGVGLDDFLDALIDAAGERRQPRLVLGDGIPTHRPSTASRTRISGSTRALVADYYVPGDRGEADRARPRRRRRPTRPTAPPTRPQVEALDAASKAKIETIPAANRKLVTFHDAFPYFAAHYGFELVGVILAERRAGADGLRSGRARREGQGSAGAGGLLRGAVQPGAGRDARPRGGRHARS